MSTATAEVQMDTASSSNEVTTITKNKNNRRMVDLEDPKKAFQIITQNGSEKFIKKLSKYLSSFAQAMDDDED